MRRELIGGFPPSPSPYDMTLKGSPLPPPPQAFCPSQHCDTKGGKWTTYICRIRRKIRLIEGNADCCHLKNLPVVSVYLSEAQNPIPPPLTHCKRNVYTVYSFTQGIGEGESWTREKYHKAGSKIPTRLSVSPVYKLWLTPAAKSIYRLNFLDDDILLWCLYT